MRLLIFWLICMTPLIASAEVDERTKAKAQTCAACHGPKGESPNPLWPNLAHQKRDYLIKQLNDFRAGRRNDPMMSPMAKTLAEEEIESLANYFSQMEAATR